MGRLPTADRSRVAYLDVFIGFHSCEDVLCAPDFSHAGDRKYDFKIGNASFPTSKILQLNRISPSGICHSWLPSAKGAEAN